MKNKNYKNGVMLNLFQHLHLKKDQEEEILKQVQDDESFFHDTIDKRAFTLIELLVVVLIIGILSAIALPQYQKAVAKARYMQLLPIGRSLLEAQRVYYLANGTYATTFDELDMTPPGTLNESKTSISNDNFYCAFNGPKEFLCQEQKLPNGTFLMVYVETNMIDCRAYHDFGKKICTSVGGVFRNSDSSSGYTNYTLYKGS